MGRLATSIPAQQSTASRCPHCGRDHDGMVRGAVLSGAGPGVAAGATAEQHGRCCRWLVWRGGFVMNGEEEVGGQPHSGRACVHSSGWNMRWMATTTWRSGRTRRLRTRRWNNLRMPMKMRSRAVGKRGSRRFASAAAGAACRTKTFLVFKLF